MFDGLTWILCESGLLFAMCAAYLAGKALSVPTKQASDGDGGGEKWETTRLKAARVLVFGLGMPLFRILFLRHVVRVSIARIGATAATSMEAVNAGASGRKGKAEDVEDVEDVEERRKDLRGGGGGQTPPGVSETAPSVVDRERSTKTHVDLPANSGDCECGSVPNIVSVNKDEIIADPGLVRMLLAFESAFSMVDTVIILLTPDNTGFALAIFSSHMVHLVQCFFRARRWRTVLAESKLKTRGIAAGLNTWVTIATTNGAAAYITTTAAMVMVLWFDARGVFNDVHPHATREQVAARTAVTMVVQLVVNILLTAFEKINKEPEEWFPIYMVEEFGAEFVQKPRNKPRDSSTMEKSRDSATMDPLT
ncbi:hypothetical protein HK104_003363 [Borealophlyctis nickersoniae]|nr:hypothetical protein HK104_003363 [Borealophlyctis nickersoniae]